MTDREGDLDRYNPTGAMRKLGRAVVYDIEEVFKETCSPINYEKYMRNPEEEKEAACKAEGILMQITYQDDKWQRFLLQLPDGNFIYVSYEKEEGADQLLEGDRVTVYGNYIGTETYTTVIWTSKTIPHIQAYFIDLQ